MVVSNQVYLYYCHAGILGIETRLSTLHFDYKIIITFHKNNFAHATGKSSGLAFYIANRFERLDENPWQ